MARSVLTTGGNSGIGLATALELARRGFRSVASVRSDAKAALVAKAAADAGLRVETVHLDVTDAAGCARVIDELRPWGLVNNAGFSAMGAIEDIGDEEARAAFETMVLAPMRLTPITGWYQAAKHALEALSDALRIEVASAGVAVVLVEPGGFKTGIWDEMKRDVERRQGSRYETAYRRSLESVRWMELLMGDPAGVAAVVGRAMTARSPRARYLVGYDAQLIALTHPVWVTPVKDRIIRLILGL